MMLTHTHLTAVFLPRRPHAWRRHSRARRRRHRRPRRRSTAGGAMSRHRGTLLHSDLHAGLHALLLRHLLLFGVADGDIDGADVMALAAAAFVLRLLAAAGATVRLTAFPGVAFLHVAGVFLVVLVLAKMLGLAAAGTAVGAMLGAFAIHGAAGLQLQLFMMAFVLGVLVLAECLDDSPLGNGVDGTALGMTLAALGIAVPAKERMRPFPGFRTMITHESSLPRLAAPRRALPYRAL